MSMNETSRRHILTAGAAAIGATAVAAPVAGLPAIATAAVAAPVEMAGAPPMSDVLAQAIERHKAARAATVAHKGPEDLPEDLVDAEDEAVAAVAAMPVASDAEALAKLKYLLDYEKSLCGDAPRLVEKWGSALVALNLHLNGEALS